MSRGRNFLENKKVSCKNQKKNGLNFGSIFPTITKSFYLEFDRNGGGAVRRNVRENVRQQNLGGFDKMFDKMFDIIFDKNFRQKIRAVFIDPCREI